MRYSLRDILPADLRNCSREFFMRTLPIGFLLVAIVAASGCGGTEEIEGGTPGIIHVGSTPLADVHVSVYRPDATASEPLAFGVSDANGRFVLRRRESLEGAWLEPGEYRCTIESAGEFQLHWPAEFQSPQDSPLNVNWSSAEKELDLNVPEPATTY